jgi:hypothetical protein
LLNQGKRRAEGSEEVVAAALGMVLDLELEQGQARDPDLEVEPLLPGVNFYESVSPVVYGQKDQI